MHRLRPTPTYEGSATRLGRNARAALRIVEDGIAQDPHHGVRRRGRPDGVVIDYSAEGLLLAYRVLGPTLVELIDVIDLRDT
jgi:hypothetical protein